MGFKDFFLSNYVILFELFGLLITLFISVHIPNNLKRITRITIYLVIINAIISYVEAWTAKFETLSIWRPILTACKYTLYPTILLMVVFLLSALINPITKRTMILLSIPIIVCIPLFFTSQWTHLICYYSEENGYHGGVLSRLPYVLFGLYLLIFIIENIIYLKHYSLRDKIIIIFISLGSFLGVILYLVFEFTDNYVSIFTSSILLYYLFLYIHLAGIDPLTGLVNRKCYYHDLQTKAEKITSIVSIDMNNLKTINDNSGHDAGDIALKTVGDIIQKNSGRQSICYRIGGDEFIIIYYGAKENEVLINIDAIKNKLQETPYSCAFGYSMVENKQDVEEAIKQADEKMYQNKAIMKSQIK